jgi:amidase
MTNQSTGYTGPELCALDAHVVVKMLKAKEIKPEELLDAAFERIAQVEPKVNALPTLCEKRARDALETLERQAKEADELPGWLAGLPITIKDLAAVSGVRSTWGTPALEDYIPEQSDPVVERLEARGGVVIAKSNTPEMGAGGNTFNAVFGMTRNPWDTSKNAGGSSGGAAVSLATGEAWLSHGSDLAGSLRTPAAYCGVVGLRPCPGRACGGPADLAFSTEGVQGPMARNVMDAALFLDALSGFDPSMPISIDAPLEPFQQAVKNAGQNVRIAWSPDLNGFAPVEKSMTENLQKALAKAESTGCTVIEACPKLPGLYETYITLRAMFWAALPGRLPKEVQQGFKRTLRENIDLGRHLTTDQIYDAQRNRSIIFANMHNFLQDFDVLAFPVVGLDAGPVEEEYPASVNGQKVKDYVDWLRFSFLSTTTGLPSLSLPVGTNEHNMPVGLQLIGPPRGEAKLLGVARAIERAVIFTTGPIDPRC